MFVLDDIDYSDEYALTFGFTSDKEIETFKETLEVRQKLEAPKTFSNIDVLVPIYSKAEIVEKNGQNFARLELYGIEGKSKQEKNRMMGVAMGLFAYNSASSSSTYSSMAMPIALTTGIAASELFKTSKVDSRYFSQTYEMPVYEDNFETESDLRKYMIDNLNDGKDMYFTMNAWSKNLNNAKIEKKINEEILK
jgi:hypothetical protein